MKKYRYLLFCAGLLCCMINAYSMPKKELVLQSGHSDSIRAIDFSRDGKKFFSLSEDNVVKVWDSKSGMLIQSFSGETSSTPVSALSPGGKLVAYIRDKNRILLWNLETNSIEAEFTSQGGSIEKLVFSPDGTLLAEGAVSMDDQSRRIENIKLWDLKKKKLHTELPGIEGQLTVLTFSPEADILAIAGYQMEMQFWDINQGCFIEKLRQKGTIITFSPDSNILAIGTTNHPEVNLWYWKSKDFDKANKSFRFNSSNGIVSLAFSPAGNWVAAGSMDETVRVWDILSGDLLKTFTGHKGPVTSIAFSPDGKTLVSGCKGASIKIWDTSSLLEAQSIPGFDAPMFSIFSPRGRFFSSYMNDWPRKLKIWNLEDNSLKLEISNNQNYIISQAFSPDEQLLAIAEADGSIKIHHIEKNITLTTIFGEFDDLITSLAFSPDSKILAVGSFDKTIELWNINDNKLLSTFSGHMEAVTSLLFSPQGKWLVSGGAEGSLLSWDMESFSLNGSFKGHEKEITSIAFSHDGKTLASAAYDNKVCIWNFTQKDLKHTLNTKIIKSPSLRYSPDGKILAMCGGMDSLITFWDTKDYNLAREISANENNVSLFVFSPDGKTLITFSTPSNALVRWDIKKGEPQTILMGHYGWISSLFFSPDDDALVSVGFDRTIRFWDLQTKSQKKFFIGYKDIAFSRDRKTTLFLDMRGYLKVYNNQKNEIDATIYEEFSDLSLSPTGDSFVAKTDDYLGIWDLKTFVLEKILTEYSEAKYSPDGKTLLLKGKNSIDLWDIENQKYKLTLKTNAKNFDSYTHPVFSPSGKMIITEMLNKISIWDSETGMLKKEITGSIKYATRMALSPDEKKIALSSERAIEVIAFDTGVRVGEIITVKGGKSLFTMTFSPDSKSIIYGCKDGSIFFEKLEDEVKPIKTIEGNKIGICSVAFSPDGKKVAFQNSEDLLGVWDNKKKQLKLHAYKKTGGQLPLLCSANKKDSISAFYNGDGNIYIFNSKGYWRISDSIKLLHNSTPSSMALSPYGNQIAVGMEQGSVLVWDLERKEIIHRFDDHKNKVISLAFSPDGKTIATGAEDSKIIIRKEQDFLFRAILSGHKGAVLSLAFNHQGNLLASGGADKTVMIWDVSKSPESALQTALTGHMGAVNVVSFSPDGKFFVSGGEDENIRLWNPSEKFSSIKVLSGHQGNIHSLQFIRDYSSYRLISGSDDNTIKQWDLESFSVKMSRTINSGDLKSLIAKESHIISITGNGQVIRWSNQMTMPHVVTEEFAYENEYFYSLKEDNLINFSDNVFSQHGKKDIEFFPGGETLAAVNGDNRIDLWNVACFPGQTSLKVFKPSQRKYWSIDYDPKRKVLSAGGTGRIIGLWDLEKQAIYSAIYFATPLSVQSLMISPDSKSIAAIQKKNNIILWDMDTMESIYLLYEHSVKTIDFSPDSKIIASGGFDYINLRDAKTGELIKTLSGHKAGTYALAFSQRGELASGGMDKTIKIWNTETGEISAQLPGHESAVLALAFSPDGHYLASGGADNTLRIWDMEKAKLVWMIYAENIGSYAAYSPLSGESVISPGGERLLGEHKDK